MYTAIFALIYLIVNFKKLKNIQIIKKLLINILLVLIITSFFWMPLLEHKLNTNYEVFKSGRMERPEVLIAYKLNFTELFFTNSNGGMIYEIGLLSVIALILTPFVMKRLKRNNKKTALYKMYLFCLISGIICLIMTLKIFPFENMPSILKMIQFTFRLLEFSAFFLSFIVAININILMPKKIKNYDTVIVLILLIFLSLFYVGHLHYLDEPFDEMKLYPAIKVTSDTGRVHPGLASFEYLPSKAFENRKYLEERPENVIILSGRANILNEYKNGSKMSFEVEDVEEQTTIELPYIYYLGYEVKVKANENNKITKLETFESENGFVAINVSNLENAKIEVSYEGTFIMKFSRIISISCIILLLGLLIRKKIKS